MKLEGVVQVVAPVNLWDAEYQVCYILALPHDSLSCLFENHVVHDAGVLLTAESKVVRTHSIFSKAL